MVTLDSLVYGGSYAEGARTLTAGKPRMDGSVDYNNANFPRKIREQLNWLNVNETDIPSIISSLTAKTVGVNVSIQVESKSASFNAQAEEFIEEFCGFGMETGTAVSNCELTGKHHATAAIRLMSDFAALHGGFIVRHHYNPEWTIPYKFELVGVDMIDTSKNVKSITDPNGKYTTLNGLERNKYGQISHVWIYNGPTKRTSTRVSYSELTYYSEVWVSIDQQAAISKLTSILSKLDDSSQYGTAELQAAVEEAKAGHFIESAAYGEVMKIVAEEINRASTTAGNGADRISGAKDMVTPILQALSNLGIKTKGLTPIPMGDVVHFNNSKRAGIYKDLTANAEMKISASQGMSDIGVFSKAADANYSSIKYTLETDQRTADIRFNDISNKVLFEIFARAVRVGIQIGRIGQRVAYWKNEGSFLKFRYLRQNKIDTEPAKNAVANKTNIALGTTTAGQIVEQTQGVKYESFLANKFEEDLLQLSYEVKLAEAKKKAYEKAGIILETEEKL